MHCMRPVFLLLILTAFGSIALAQDLKPLRIGVQQQTAEPAEPTTVDPVVLAAVSQLYYDRQPTIYFRNGRMTMEEAGAKVIEIDHQSVRALENASQGQKKGGLLKVKLLNADNPGSTLSAEMLNSIDGLKYVVFVCESGCTPQQLERLVAAKGLRTDIRFFYIVSVPQ